MTLIRRGSAKRRHEARRAWLLPRVEEFADAPGLHDDVTDANRPHLDRLCAAMEAAQLFGRFSGESNRETARRILSELRGESVGIGW